jgi:uncharacterized membrane protein (UPF0127 family)
MAKLIYKNKIILKDMKYVTSIWQLARGLMFASKKKIKKGLCMVMLGQGDKRFGVSIHMVFCFYPYEILFINTKHEVVDKVLLKPFSVGYTPKKPCKYVIESWKGTFKDIKVGDKVEIKK